MRRSCSQASLSTIGDVLYQRNKLVSTLPGTYANTRTRPEGKQYQERNMRGAGVAALFSIQQPEPPKPLKPQKKEVKNYLAENKIDIFKLEQEIKEARRKMDEKRAERENQQHFVMKKFQDVPSRYNTNKHSLTRTKSAINIHSTNPISNDVVVTNNDEVTTKENIENGEITGVPSSTMAAPRLPSSTITTKRHKNDVSDKDFLKLNIMSVDGKPGFSKRAPFAVEAEKRDQLFQKSHKIGKLPKYLVDRKMVMGTEKSKNEVPDPDCPPGHVLLCNEDRKNTLEMLKKSKEEIINKLQRLPLRCDTLRLIKLHKEYMTQLEEIDEAEKIFSKPKVFVLNDNHIQT